MCIVVQEQWVHRPRQGPNKQPLLQTSLAAAIISRWTASLSHAAMHAFTASLLAQDCSNHTKVEGNQPTLSQALAEAPLHATDPSRLPARSSGAPAAWRLTSKTVLVRGMTIQCRLSKFGKKIPFLLFGFAWKGD